MSDLVTLGKSRKKEKVSDWIYEFFHPKLVNEYNHDEGKTRNKHKMIHKVLSQDMNLMVHIQTQVVLRVSLLS